MPIHSIEVRYEDETLWLTQKMMAALFDVSVPTINEHLKNIYDSGELEQDPTIRKFRIVQLEGARNVTREIDHYNLDAVISVGYRVNSIRATQFRRWATQVCDYEQYLRYHFFICEKPEFLGMTNHLLFVGEKK